jgi:hypothetical protein
MKSAKIKSIGDVDVILDMFVLDWQCQLCSPDGAESTFRIRNFRIWCVTDMCVRIPHTGLLYLDSHLSCLWSLQ